MKGIVLHQPWASFMAIGVKTNETRGHRIHHRGELVIIAAKASPPCPENLFQLLLKYRGQLAPGEVDVPGILAALPKGRAVCVVEVYDCVPAASSSAFAESPDRLLEQTVGDYSVNRWAWKTRNVRRFKEPFAFRGHQGLVWVPAEIVYAALDQPIAAQ